MPGREYQPTLPAGATLVARLRAAGCVFAEEEAEILREAAGHDADLLDDLTVRRIGGAPLEPLVGWVDFAGLRLSVGPGVFVPRQRSVRLLESTLDALRTLPRTPPPVFVEAFAGAAPLASAVARALPHVRVVACEIDAAALTHARLNLGSRGVVHQSAVLAGLPPALRGTVAVIAAVPPYVPSAQLAMLPREAREHEPKAALSGGDDGLRWVEALLTQARDWLTPGGHLLMEMSRHQIPAALHLAARHRWRADAQPSDAQDEDRESLTTVLTVCSPA